MKSCSLDDLKLFIKAAECNSLTEASEVLEIPLATLSRRLKNLENCVNGRLIDRNARQYVLTKLGESYFSACLPIISSLENVHKQLQSEQSSLGGSLKITAPTNMTQIWLKQCILDFSRLYPDINIELTLNNELEDLSAKKYDIAFRVGDLRNSEWIARSLWQIKFVLVASQNYLNCHPSISHPRELTHHKLITVSPKKQWHLVNHDNEETFQLKPNPVFHTNDILTAQSAAAEGLGIAMIPSYYTHFNSVLNRTLKPILPEWHGGQNNVWLMYRDRKQRPARISAFIDYVLTWQPHQHNQHLNTLS